MKAKALKDDKHLHFQRQQWIKLVVHFAVVMGIDEVYLVKWNSN